MYCKNITAQYNTLYTNTARVIKVASLLGHVLGEGLGLELRSVYIIKSKVAGTMRVPGSERKVREFYFESGKIEIIYYC